ncbi:hypothetical protein RclHR1_03010006 [Rhizophagus clarus]|uniref:Uncharacterized protein n=1 Tax=Rhizophagus clarus TaxID=94130 RepID=A0A2Z6R5V3_9GLOM|nr:hypothetical protein RclHR1_03010006 [Rhizophagus clarus]GES85620.1 hypothetical protein GLOIN_2v1835724 [Rhizophagus clarus]
MDQSRNPNFTETDNEISNISDNDLNISVDSSDTCTTRNSSSYASRVIRRRRNQRRLRHGITINTYILNRIRSLPIQITNDPFSNQIFNGSTFH